MGTFSTSITVLGADADHVIDLLTSTGRRAYVAMFDDGTVLVCDEAGDNQDGSHAVLARQIAATLGCRSLAVLNHDDDVLLLHAYDGATSLGSCSTDPDFIDDPDPSGAALDGAALATLAGRPEVAAAIDTILATDHVFAVDQHAELVEALGLPAGTVGLGYRYLEAGDRPDGATTVRLV